MSDSMEKTTSNLLLPIISTFGSVEKFCVRYSESKTCPSHLQNNPTEIQIMIAYGLSFGLNPFAAIKNVMVVDNIPSLYGDAVTAMCYATGQLEKLQVSIEETDEVLKGVLINGKEAKNIIARCVIKRRGVDEIHTSFSLKEAAEAELLFITYTDKKTGQRVTRPKKIWHSYTTRMLSWRAKTYAIREAFPDKLVGLTTFEEVIDYPTVNQDREIIFNENGSARYVENKPASQASFLAPRKAEVIDEVVTTAEVVESNSDASVCVTEGVENNKESVTISDKELDALTAQSEKAIVSFINSPLDVIEKRIKSPKYIQWKEDLQKKAPEVYAGFIQSFNNVYASKKQNEALLS